MKSVKNSPVSGPQVAPATRRRPDISGIANQEPADPRRRALLLAMLGGAGLALPRCGNGSSGAAHSGDAWIGSDATADTVGDGSGAAGVNDLSVGRPWLPPLAPLTADQIALLQQYDKEMRFPTATPNGSGADMAKIDTVEKRIRDLWHITRDASGKVTGDPLATQAGKGVPFYDPGTQQTTSDCLLVMGLAYQKATPEQVARIQPLYLDLAEHMLNEFARQKSYPPITQAWFYNWPNQFTVAVFGMTTILQQGGLLERLMRDLPFWTNPRWLDESIHTLDSDDLRICRWREISYSIAYLPMGPEKWQRFKAAERYFNGLLNQDNGGTAFPASGEFSHHSNLNLDYNYAIHSFFWGDFKALLRAGMTFGPATRERLRAYGRLCVWSGFANWNWSAGHWELWYPGNINLRPGYVRGWSSKGELPLNELATMGAIDGSGPFDAQCARFYLAMYPGDNGQPKGAATADFLGKGHKPQELVGVMALPYRPAMIWRNQDTVVSVAGLATGRYGYEDYGGNEQSRYICNGSVQIYRGKDPQGLASYRNGPGWNECMHPGATSLLETGPDINWPGARCSNGSPVGGICLLGGNAAVAANLQTGSDTAGLFCIEFANTDQMRVQFRRSVVAFGNQLLVLTSGIGRYKGYNPVTLPPAITALYQSALPDPAKLATSVDGETQTSLTAETTYALDKPRTLVDPQGAQYIVLPVPGAAAQPTLRVARRNQSWTAFNKTVSTGDCAVAWLDHGTGTGGSGAHVVRPLDANRYAGVALPQILLQSGAAHAAFDADTKTYAYAAFADNLSWAGAGPLLQTSQTAALLVREMGPGLLRVSVASWRPPMPSNDVIAFKLAGAWKLQAAAAGVSAVPDGSATQVVVARAATAIQFHRVVDLVAA